MEKIDRPTNGKSTKQGNGRLAFDPKTFLATVNHGRTVTEYRAGDVVFLQARPADSVFYIQKGRIKIVVASKQGKEAVVALLGPGEFFGEVAALDWGAGFSYPRTASVTATSNLRLLVVPASLLNELVRDAPGFGRIVKGAMSERLPRR